MRGDNCLVSVLIVNWNGAEVLPKCLESLLRLNHKNIEIVMVDNGSTDDSVDIAKKICGGKVRVVCLEKNIGFPAGINAGVENCEGEFIATLNNDMVVEPSWLDKPLEMLGDESVGIVSCRQMNYYDHAKVDELYPYITKALVVVSSGVGRPLCGDEFSLRPGYVIGANGGSAIIRAETIRALGGYDADFFGYIEETDFCVRALLRGWRCVYAPDAVVYHMNGFSFKKIGARRYYLRERNRVWFLYKNFPLRYILERLPYILVREARVFGFFCLKLKNPFVYFKAKWDAFRGISRYKRIRKENVALFRARKDMFLRFEKYKKLELAV